VSGWIKIKDKSKKIKVLILFFIIYSGLFLCLVPGDEGAGLRAPSFA